jgi:hypothetical protein
VLLERLLLPILGGEITKDITCSFSRKVSESSLSNTSGKIGWSHVHNNLVEFPIATTMMNVVLDASDQNDEALLSSTDFEGLHFYGGPIGRAVWYYCEKTVSTVPLGHYVVS